MARFASRLLSWYNKNKRNLPWRAPGLSPYAIWVSEMMLQQTRVETVIPYYQAWLNRFPTVESLAAATQREVLNVWEGLGYYNRARNFHDAAKILVKKYEGLLPQDLKELQTLPGIGRYTAGALASIVFEMDEPALDGNIKRVYSRLFDIDEPVDSSVGERTLWSLARKHLPKGRAADFNQALMDLGAAVCLPKNPRCSICPLDQDCLANARKTQNLRPVKKSKDKLPHHTQAAAVIVKRRKVLLAQRPQKGLLGGMWEFPNGRVEGNPAGELAQVVRKAYNLRLRVERNAIPLAVVKHSYSHFKVSVVAFRCDAISGQTLAGLKWVSVKNLDEYPMGKIDRQIANILVQ